MVKVVHTDTIWTAPASTDVSALSQLDMRVPFSGGRAAKTRARKMAERSKATLARYASRATTDSLRKLVK